MSNKITYSAFESRYKSRTYIGSGGFAKVYKVFDHARNHYVALKIADVKPEWDKFTLKNEVELVNKLPLHRNIARYDACYRFNTGSLTGEMDFAILRFYEYGNLDQFLKKQELSIEDKKLILQGILDGVAFLHNNNVIHRDIKSQNILMHREDGVWTPKITDFGLSREILESGDITNSAIGLSYAYAAPEQIQNKKIYKNVDLWAVGVIMYKTMTGELPFRGRSDGDDKSTQSQLEISRKIINLEIPDLIHSIQEPYQAMIKRCLVLDPRERIQTAEELMEIMNGPNNMSSPPIDLMVPPMDQDDEKTQVLSSLDYPSQVDSPPNPSAIMPPSNDAEKVMDEQLTNRDAFEAKPIEDEKTELIQRKSQEEKQRNQQSAYTPPSPSNFTPPQSFNPVPSEEYKIPKQNVTQILKNKISTPEEEIAPPVTSYQPNVGDPVRRFSWLWILLPLLLIGAGGGGAYYWYSNQGNSPVAKVEEPEKNKEASVAPVKDRFETIDANIEKYKTRKSRLLRLREDVNVMIKAPEHKNNYRPQYLSAKIAAYAEKNPRSALKALISAARIAIENGDAKRMLWDIEKDKLEAFKNIEKIKKNWNPIIQSLEEMN